MESGVMHLRTVTAISASTAAARALLGTLSPSPLPLSLTNDVHDDLSLMSARAVLPQVDTLPCSEHQFTPAYRNRNLRRRERGAHVCTDEGSCLQARTSFSL